MQTAQLTQSAKQCLVQVQGRIAGSGFLAAPGYVVTCAHVAGAVGSPVKLSWQGAELDGTVSAASPAPAYGGLWPYPDLAIVRLVDPPEGHPCAWWHDRIPMGGQQLATVGHSDKYRSEPEPLTSTFVYQGDQFLDGGLMLRLKQDEVTPGMSGGPVLNLSTGGVCAVVKATRMDSTDMGGLATPIGALRRLDPAVYRALVRAHDAFHAQDLRWPDATEGDATSLWSASIQVRAQRKLFGLLATAPVPESESLPAAFRDAAGRYAAHPELPLHEHRDVIGELDALGTADHGMPRVFRHVAAVACKLPGDLGTRLRSWIESQGDVRQLDRRDLAQLLQSSSPRPTVQRSVMVRFRPSPVDHSRYHVAMWRYEGQDAISPAAAESAALPLAEALALARRLLPEQLAILGRSLGDTVMVELIVPQELMEEAFDEWKPWARHAWMGLGRKHPVVLRDLERFDDEELRQYWRIRWNRFTAEAAVGGPSMALACDDDEADHEMLEGWIESEPALAVLVLAGSLRVSASEAALEVALASGVPVVLWRRSGLEGCSGSRRSACPSRIGRACRRDGESESCPAEEFFRSLRGDMGAAPPAQWPERVRQLRGEAVKHRSVGHHAQDLVLLWDDPERRLPDASLRYA
ncbi:trypsin-like peptidase domain-containing protein [Streptomyces sp. NPDC048275]|uniref:VMAP-C domain-containing protein n=1 Tax=Streptomyces sp. NPDC048275 TaxID=3155629 RepID=UPI0033F0F578